MEVKEFVVEGAVQLKDGWRKFRIRKRGVKEEDVRELVLSELGSRFKVKRALVRIEAVRMAEAEGVVRKGRQGR